MENKDAFPLAIICILVLGSFFLFTKCVSDDTKEREQTARTYNDLQKCMNGCAGLAFGEKDCMNRCLDIEEKRVSCYEQQKEQQQSP